ncbi:vacuolar protein sorting-associated protein 51 [Dorcoceras hygrometricum]|uniref:Vacuolar protein sorting-associated protein 51 n=1 Tax=Dorcoceras hygrometricum TaxID=472368 RepID=A0A2Z6ZZC2_9LAMI|nr:vacuolar protein sorting-associated protein 51 [Dorcoceras hygrometricum]
MVVKQKETTSVDDVDNIIEEVIAATAKLETDVVQPDLAEGTAMGTVLTNMEEDSVKYMDTDFLLIEPATEKEIDLEPAADMGQLPLDEESLSIDDLLKRIPEENLPKISLADKGKAPLDEPDTIKGHPAREMFHLICGDIEFLVQLRERVIDDVAAFFSSFSLRHLAVMKSLNGISSNEEKVLMWGETDSVQIALQRRLYIVAKTISYPESMILRKPLPTLVLNKIKTFEVTLKAFARKFKFRKLPYPLKYMSLSNTFELKVAFFSTDLANIRKEVRDLSNEFDYKLAVIRNDLFEFRVETQEQFATLRDNLAELIAFVTKGRDDQKGGRVSRHEKEEAVDLGRKVGDTG